MDNYWIGYSIFYLQGDETALIEDLVRLAQSAGCSIQATLIGPRLANALIKATTGTLSKNRNYKRIKSIKLSEVFEFRFTFNSICGPLECRLFFSANIRERKIVLINWHIKDSTLSPVEQRLLQNQAAPRAAYRLEQETN